MQVNGNEHSWNEKGNGSGLPKGRLYVGKHWCSEVIFLTGHPALRYLTANTPSVALIVAKIEWRLPAGRADDGPTALSPEASRPGGHIQRRWMPPITPPNALPGGTLISYETESGPFCGRCERTKLTVGSDGRIWIEQGHWAGRYEDWTTDRHIVKVGPERVDAFMRALEPYPPEGTLALNEMPPCKEFWTDMAGVRVSWVEGGKTSRLIYNFGCDPTANEEMRSALEGAPVSLGFKLKP